MTVRALVVAWIAAVGLVVGGMAAMLLLHPAQLHPFRGDDVAVIGSSLLDYAVPETGAGAASLLGDGRKHRRIGIDNISEHEEMVLGERALDDGARVIFLEIDPMLFNYAQYAQKRACYSPGLSLRIALKDRQTAITDALRAEFGLRGQYDGVAEPGNLGFHQMIDYHAAASDYPLAFHQPCFGAQLAEMVARARRQGSRIVLVLPPVSPAGVALMGAGQQREIAARAQDLARRLGVPLFSPDGPWSNSEFIDQGHVNSAGRGHFLSSLRRWWRAQP